MSRLNPGGGGRRDLDALLREAVDAWVDLDAHGGRDDPLRAVDPGFAERVMAAETEVHPPLFAVPDPVDDPLPIPRKSWGPWAWRVAAGIAAGVAAGLAGAMVLRPKGEDPDAGAVAARAESLPPSTRTATRPIRETATPMQLRPDGTPGAPIPADLDAKVRGYIADYGKFWGPAFEFHGVVIVARDGKVGYGRGFGMADPERGTRNTENTRFRLGMLTEQFTAAAILQLRDRGALALQDPVERYLPEFPFGDRITIQHLLDHSSGLPNYTDDASFDRWKHRPHTTDEMLARIASTRLEFEPGTDVRLTNAGYYVLGAIIEQVSGMSYGEYVRTRLLEPAGMSGATYGDAYETGEQARGHVWNEEETLDPPDPIDMSVFGGAAGLVASAVDLVQWDTALDDGLILDPASVEEMRTPRRKHLGYGLMVSQGYGQRVVGFAGLIDGFSGAMLQFTQDDTAVVVLCNTEVVPCDQVALDVAMLVYGDEPAPRKEHAEVSIAPGVLSKYVGVYSITADTRQQHAGAIEPERFDLLRTVYVRQLGDRLYFDVPGHGMTWMHPMGHHQFFFKDHSGNTLSFEVAEGDRAERMFVHYYGTKLELDRDP